MRYISTFTCLGSRPSHIEHLQTVLDSPRLMHSREPECKSNSHKARTDFAARNTSGSCSARFWFTRLRIYTVVFGHALTESGRVESSRVGERTVPATSRAIFTLRVRRWGTCAQVHARAHARPVRRSGRMRAWTYTCVRTCTSTCGVCRWVAVWLRWLPDRPPLLSVTRVAVGTEQTRPRTLHPRSLCQQRSSSRKTDGVVEKQEMKSSFSAEWTTSQSITWELENRGICYIKICEFHDSRTF